ncbi:Kelch repeat-containing protein [Sorangium sp. So ce1389]|uniref:Kelch repeat-containing protein n=1 Tax=Sorangium sp. So ce1389 TaxID=3133336 RepID=UPI003F5E762D
MMIPRRFLQRVVFRCAPLLWASASLAGCSAEPERPAPSAALRGLFPDQAATVLAAREAFVADAQGFHLGTAAASASRLRVALPRDGSEPIRFRTPGGAEVRVREHGAFGAGIVVERAVAYGRTAGTSFWTATDRGAEEWLLLDEGIAHGEAVVETWQVDGATLRARGEAVELVEEQRGTPLLRVTAPRAYTASGRPVTASLKAQGSRIELSVDAGGEAVLVDPAWELVGVMNVARKAHTATLLRSGELLMAGGTEIAAHQSAELYTPTTDSWTLTAPLNVPRFAHTATLMPSGKVLVAGGIDELTTIGFVYLASAELYDPALEIWTTTTSPMSHARTGHTATLLSSGLVLMTGGSNGDDNVASAEVYDPAADTWTPATSMNHARAGHTATLLSSGLVLITGGYVGNNVAAIAEVYDPAADTWTLTGPMRYPRGGHTATLLSSGLVLVAGGADDGGAPVARAEVYDPAADTWTLASPMTQPRGGHTATMLPSGLILVAGGTTAYAPVDDAELYDPTAGLWIPTSRMQIARRQHTATVLPSGEALVAGGSNGTSNLATTERFGIAPGDACTGAAAVCLFDGRCVDGTCCDAPCPCGTCSDEGHCGPEGSPAKAGTICAPPTCIDEIHSTEPARCTLASSTCPSPASIDCIVYRCDQESGACKTSCASLDDCAPGFVCNLRGHCVSPPPAPGVAGGCSTAPGLSTSPAARSLGWLLLGLRAARRRAARRRRSTAAALLAVVIVAALAGEAAARAQPAKPQAASAPPSALPAAPPAAVAPPGSAAADPRPAEEPPVGRHTTMRRTPRLRAARTASTAARW